MAVRTPAMTVRTAATIDADSVVAAPTLGTDRQATSGARGDQALRGRSLSWSGRPSTRWVPCLRRAGRFRRLRRSVGCRRWVRTGGGSRALPSSSGASGMCLALSVAAPD